MSFPYLFKKEVKDQYTQDNFKRISDYHFENAMTRCNFSFLEIPVLPQSSNFKWPHGLKFVPMDVIIIHNSSNSNIVFNYDKFDAINLDITSSAETKLRLLVGRYI